ncbi:nuclear transport factor 2 family protein [Tahibacter amnicola]|uniref:Ester cyclase n=1 Tax=Tahibacter amnicola TaxID=2976241 RepID=A0ABY6BD60_9GAMM|nr:ester cyclase [Tahibacter amnicola]UXI65847.1 ester cyclase [Tahibacter amnicola]
MASSSIQDTAIEFLTLCASGDVRTAYERHVAAGFRHHNPHFRSDRTSLLEAMEKSAAEAPNTSFDVKQAIAAGDTVAVLSQVQRVQQGFNYAVVHILRFEDSKIAEMWDVGQEIPADSPNELGMF